MAAGDEAPGRLACADHDDGPRARAGRQAQAQAAAADLRADAHPADVRVRAPRRGGETELDRLALAARLRARHPGPALRVAREEAPRELGAARALRVGERRVLRVGCPARPEVSGTGRRSPRARRPGCRGSPASAAPRRSGSRGPSRAAGRRAPRRRTSTCRRCRARLGDERDRQRVADAVVHPQVEVAREELGGARGHRREVAHEERAVLGVGLAEQRADGIVGPDQPQRPGPPNAIETTDFASEKLCPGTALPSGFGASSATRQPYR